MERTSLEHADGTLHVDEIGSGRRRLTVVPRSTALFIHETTCETTYPLELIRAMFEAHGIADVCFEIMRDQDPTFVERYLRNDIFAYFDQEELDGIDILDFGCGDGASTFILSRMFPNSEITGVELVPAALEIARKRAEFYQNPKVRFISSPSGDSLPEDLGQFGFVVMSAVFEHLLPNERPIIMRLLWSKVKNGGHLFLNQTPNRVFPVELHTTMLPLINYLPDKITYVAARKLSRRITDEESWELLLRKGIRGGTVSEICGLLGDEHSRPVLLEPSKGGLNDRIDLYYKNTNPTRLRRVKSLARSVIKTLNKVTGVMIIPDLSLAFKKAVRD